MGLQRVLAERGGAIKAEEAKQEGAKQEAEEAKQDAEAKTRHSAKCP